ncbi:hypothetical protein JHK86_019054 [Glycine max]|nr:hypothetical protein JHK86_019054 [Glycine max]
MEGGEDLHHHHHHHHRHNNFPFQLLEKKEDQETASCSTSSLYPSLEISTKPSMSNSTRSNQLVVVAMQQAMPELSDGGVSSSLDILDTIV